MLTRRMTSHLDITTKNMVLSNSHNQTRHAEQKYKNFMKRLTKVIETINMQKEIPSDATELCKTLSLLNAHPRDGHIKFQEEGHIYDIDGDKSYTSVTKFVHSFAEPFNAVRVIAGMRKRGLSSEYEGMSDADIQRKWKLNGIDASKRGTKMHYQIECFFNRMALSKSYEIDETGWRLNDLDIELGQFKKFVDGLKLDGRLVPFRTEWCVFHEELKFSGSIDMVFKNADGGYDIYDWKRAKEIKTRGFKNFKNESLVHLPDCNFWHYTMQLNLYKYILESKYGLRIDNLYLVAFHPNYGEGVFKKHKCPEIQDTMRELFASTRLII